MPTKKQKGPERVATAPQEIKSPSTVKLATLTFGLIPIPIKLHVGAREEKISFNQLHGKCLGRIRMGPIECPGCTAAEAVLAELAKKPTPPTVIVPREEVVKGYQHEKDKYVVVTEDELKALEEQTGKEIPIEAFVKSDEVDPIYFETSYYIVPENAVAAKPYHLLRRAMLESGRVAIAKLTMNGRLHIAAIKPYQDGMSLHTLYFASEIRPITFLQSMQPASDVEVKVAKQLVEMLNGEFDPLQYKDEYAEGVLKLVADKVAGNVPTAIPKKQPTSAPLDIMAAMQASIDQARKRKKAA